MDRFDPFVKYADVYGDVINWEKDPMNYPKNQNKYFFSDGKTYYEQICKMLRLMSVFKEAFNQIYDNEDEISGAWESFVENLSATAVSGSEPGVTLTWTDDSVNFEFTLVPGRDGADGTDGRDGTDGVGISSISFNSDYTMTITLTNGSVYTSESLRGPIGETGARGPQGEKGEPGEGLNILDVYSTLQDLQTAHPTGSPGEAYQVGTAPSFTLYIWSVSRSEWVPAGTLGSVSPSMSNPLMDGVASAGSSNLYARGDHVHPTDTSRASASALNNLSDTIISEYLKKTDAVGYDDILTKTQASTIYQTILAMNDYLLKNDAPGYADILTKTSASTLYQTISGMSAYLTSAVASSTYQTKTGMSEYLQKTDAPGYADILTKALASATYMPIDRIASASQLGGMKVGANLSIDADGTLNALGGNTQLSVSGVINVTGSDSTGASPTYRNVDIKYKASADYSILMINGSMECRGSGPNVVCTLTTDLTIPNWTRGEVEIKAFPTHTSSNTNTSIVISSSGSVSFKLISSTNFSWFYFLPFRLVLSDY